MQALTLRRQFWALWLLLLAIKCLFAVRLPLFGDEAWYWLEGQHPAWAYSDLPGLTAWLARLGVELGGHSEFGLRWPFVLLSMLVPLLLRAGAARWFGPEAGDRSGMLALLLPLLGGLGFLALPDVPLTFAAALCLYAALRLVERVEPVAAAWLALGLIVGAFSHYRFALMILAGFAALLLDPGGRRALRDARVWLAIAAGALAWLPLLLWNLHHGEAGFDFQLAQRHPWSLHGEGFWLPLSQLLVVTPLLLLLLLAGLYESVKRWRARAPGAWGLILGTAAVPLASYLVLAFFADRERVSFHWLLQAWLPLLVVAPVVFARWTSGAQKATLGLAALGLCAVFFHAGTADAPRLRASFADRPWYPDNFTGWNELSELLGAMPEVANGEVELIADSFMLGAQLAFAFDHPDLRVLDHPLNHKHGRAVQLRLWNLETRLDAPHARPRLLVVEDTAVPMRLRLAHYRRLCGQAGVLGTTRDFSVDHGRKRFLLFRLDDPSAAGADCVLPALAWIDAPTPRASVSAVFDVAGWAFKDGAGIARVEVSVDGRVMAVAEYGIAQPHVAEYWGVSTDAAHPGVGFLARIDARALAPGEHWLGLVLHGRDGSLERWPEQRIRIEPL